MSPSRTDFPLSSVVLAGALVALGMEPAALSTANSGAGRRATAAAAQAVEASTKQNETLSKVPQLIQDMMTAKPLVGIPRVFQFHPDNRKLYFLGDTKVAPELMSVDIPIPDCSFTFCSFGYNIPVAILTNLMVPFCSVGFAWTSGMAFGLGQGCRPI